MAESADALGKRLARLATEDTFRQAYTRRRAGDHHDRELLSFWIGGEIYAIDILRMREIVTPRPITEVPRVPRFVLGVVTVRGDIVPVLDLRRRLGFPAEPPPRTARVLICQTDEPGEPGEDGAGDRWGLLVDRVRSVVRLRDDQIEVPASAAESSFLEGIGRQDDELVILLDLPAVVTFSLEDRT